jgi:hypothetical protein
MDADTVFAPPGSSEEGFGAGAGAYVRYGKGFASRETGLDPNEALDGTGRQVLGVSPGAPQGFLRGIFDVYPFLKLSSLCGV